jgi:hypothetical protein
MAGRTYKSCGRFLESGRLASGASPTATASLPGWDLPVRVVLPHTSSEPLRDQPLLTWCVDLLEAILGPVLKAVLSN